MWIAYWRPRRSCFRSPVWNMGFPAILTKGFIDKVFLPGVSFTLGEDGCYIPCLHNISVSESFAPMAAGDG